MKHSIHSSALLAILMAAGCGSGDTPGADDDDDDTSTTGPEAAITTGDPTRAADTGGGDTTGGAGDDTGAPAQDVDAYILGLGHIAIAEPQAPVPIECEGEDCQVDGPHGDYICSYTYYSTTEHFDEFVTFQPNSATLWPGSIVEGYDASMGLLTSITLPRAPLTYSVSLENLAGSPVATMETPTLSEFRETVQQVLSAGVNGSTPARVAFELRQVFSTSEVALALSTALEWGGGNKVAAMFDFNSDQTRTRLVANFTQAYYTVDVDVPAQPSDLFDPGVTVEDLSAFMDHTSPPMYVQSITYGRRAVFSIETDRSEKEVRSALEAVISAFGGDGELEVTEEHKQLLESAKMQVFVLGGGGVAVEAVLGYQGLIKYILDGGDYSAESPGAAIAYKLAYLDNFGTKFAYTTDFAEADCQKKAEDASKLRVFVDNLYFDGNGETIGKGEMKYHVWASASGNDDCDLVQQLSEQKIGDNQKVGIGKSCDFTVLAEPGAFVTVHVLADEDGKVAQNAVTYDFVPGQGWPAFGTQFNAKNGNLDVDVNFNITVLE